MIHSLFIGALDSDDSLRGVGAVVVCGSFNGCGALVHLDSFSEGRCSLGTRFILRTVVLS